MYTCFESTATLCKGIVEIFSELNNDHVSVEYHMMIVGVVCHLKVQLTILVMGNSMPTDTLFCRPIPDFDEIWQAWGSTEETNPHQVSAHFNHF